MSYTVQGNKNNESKYLIQHRGVVTAVIVITITKEDNPCGQELIIIIIREDNPCGQEFSIIREDNPCGQELVER